MAITKFRGEYEFLSNMYPTLLYVNGELYPSAEHAFQAMKCLDRNDRIAISVCRSPQEAKQAGKLVDLRPDWESVKVNLMHSILSAKFSNADLAQKLKATGDQELIEGNDWGDNFWGVCDSTGKNMLGKLLMQVREEIA